MRTLTLARQNSCSKVFKQRPQQIRLLIVRDCKFVRSSVFSFHLDDASNDVWAATYLIGETISLILALVTQDSFLISVTVLGSAFLQYLRRLKRILGQSIVEIVLRNSLFVLPS